MNQAKSNNLNHPMENMADREYPVDRENITIERVPIHLKVTLTIREAAEYSNIGINKIDAMLRQPLCPFVLYIGTRRLVKRKAFEEYLSNKVAI